MCRLMKTKHESIKVGIMSCLGFISVFIIPTITHNRPIAFSATDKCNPHGPLTRYVKLWVAHALGMPGTFSPPPTSEETAS